MKPEMKRRVKGRHQWFLQVRGGGKDGTVAVILSSEIPGAFSLSYCSARGVLLSLCLVKGDSDGFLCKWRQERVPAACSAGPHLAGKLLSSFLPLRVALPLQRLGPLKPDGIPVL